MAQLIHQYTATIAAGTQINALQVVNIPLPEEVIVSIDIEVPPGPAGLMGFYLANSGQQMIPFESNEFIVWDDRFDTWYLDNFLTTGSWSVHGYNLDAYNAHSITLRFHDNPLTQGNSSSSPQVTINTTPLADALIL